MRAGVPAILVVMFKMTNRMWEAPRPEVWSEGGVSKGSTSLCDADNELIMMYRIRIFLDSGKTDLRARYDTNLRLGEAKPGF